LVPNAPSAGTFERAHRPNSRLVRTVSRVDRRKRFNTFKLPVGSPGRSALAFLLRRVPDLPLALGLDGHCDEVAFRAARHEIEIIGLGMASCSTFSRANHEHRRTGPRAFRGSNPGLQLTNPFRHDGWQAPIGAPAQSEQQLGKLARWRRQPSRRLRPAMHAARRARTGICN